MAARPVLRRRISREQWLRPGTCAGTLLLLTVLSVGCATILFLRYQRDHLVVNRKVPEPSNEYWSLLHDTLTSIQRSANETDSDAPELRIIPPPSLRAQRRPEESSEALKGVILGLEDFVDEEYLLDDQYFFVIRKELVNTYTPSFTIQAKQPCEANGPFLLVAVPSIRNHTIRRKAIRKTWAGPGYGLKWPRRTLRHSVKVVFFFGRGEAEDEKDDALEEESARYGDIVQADFVDTYRNLTLKMASVLHWTATHCPGARHVIKVDEDTIVNIPLLVDVLDLVSSHQGRYVMGFKHMSKQPQVIREGRWKVDEDQYPLDVFPQYLYGHSYVITGDCVQDLFDAFQRMPAVPTEDAFFTGILARTLGISRIHSAHFAHPSAYDYRHNQCAMIKDRYISHTGFRRAHILYQLWRNATDPSC